jgi:hypothetical protein
MATSSPLPVLLRIESPRVGITHQLNECIHGCATRIICAVLSGLCGEKLLEKSIGFHEVSYMVAENAIATLQQKPPWVW